MSKQDLPGLSAEDNGYRRFLLRFARHCLDADNLHYADLALQVCHQRYDQDAVSYNLHAELAYQIGLTNKAVEFLDLAIERRPDYTDAIDNRVAILQRPEQVLDVGGTPRYLLINAWGGEMGTELLYLMQQLLLAEMTHRIPIVYWGSTCLYNDDPSVDCYGNFFKPLNGLDLGELYPLQGQAFPKLWRARALSDAGQVSRWRNADNGQIYRLTGVHYLNRAEALAVAGEFTSIKKLLLWLGPHSEWAKLSVCDVYRGLLKRYLRPTANLLEQANSFINYTFTGQPFVAIHLRGTNKHHEQEASAIRSINDELIDQLHSRHQEERIFVISDDSREIDRMRQRFGARVKFIDAIRSNSDTIGALHDTRQKRKIGNEVLLDVLIAARAQRFYGCGFSNLACLISYLHSNAHASTLEPYDANTRLANVPMPGLFGVE